VVCPAWVAAVTRCREEYAQRPTRYAVGGGGSSQGPKGPKGPALTVKQRAERHARYAAAAIEPFKTYDPPQPTSNKRAAEDTLPRPRGRPSGLIAKAQGTQKITELFAPVPAPGQGPVSTGGNGMGSIPAGEKQASG
jgi:hypothetical protein